jgi:hypothetical protein
MTIPCWILRMRNVLDKVVEKIKTDILYSITFFETRAVCGIMSKTLVEPERPHMTIQRMRGACWNSKGRPAHARTRWNTNTHMYTHTCTHAHTRMCMDAPAQKYAILIAFPRQKYFRESVSVLRYTYIGFFVYNSVIEIMGFYLRLYSVTAKQIWICGVLFRLHVTHITHNRLKTLKSKSAF